MEEVWKEIPGFDLYEASNMGNVRNRKTQRLLEKYQTKNGYERLTLRQSGKYVSRDVHRLVAQAFIPNPEEKNTVNHMNRVKNDNRVENLEWATSSEQSLHARQEKYNDEYSSMGTVPEIIGDEEWRVIEPSGYSVSNTGCVRNDNTGRIMSLKEDGRGHNSVKIQGQVRLVHRLVAQAFIEGFTDACVVNHIDNDPRNNHVHNLECVSQSMNILHAYATNNIKKKKFTPCIQVDYQGNVVGSYKSLADAEAATGYNRGAIHDAMNKGVTCGRCRWYKTYEDYEEDKDNIATSIFKVFQYGMDGKLIATFDDYVHAESETDVPKGNINRCVNFNKEALSTSGGYIWTSSRVPKTIALEKLRNEQNA